MLVDPAEPSLSFLSMPLALMLNHQTLTDLNLVLLYEVLDALLVPDCLVLRGRFGNRCLEMFHALEQESGRVTVTGYVS